MCSNWKTMSSSRTLVDVVKGLFRGDQDGFADSETVVLGRLHRGVLANSREFWGCLGSVPARQDDLGLRSGKAVCFGDNVDDIATETVDTHVKPVTTNIFHLFPNMGIIPFKSGCFFENKWSNTRLFRDGRSRLRHQKTTSSCSSFSASGNSPCTWDRPSRKPQTTDVHRRCG